MDIISWNNRIQLLRTATTESRQNDRQEHGQAAMGDKQTEMVLRAVDTGGVAAVALLPLLRRASHIVACGKG